MPPPQQLVAPPAGGDRLLVHAQALRQKGPPLSVLEAPGLEAEDPQRGQEGLHPFPTKGQRRRVLALDLVRPLQAREGLFTDLAVVS